MTKEQFKKLEVEADGEPKERESSFGFGPTTHSFWEECLLILGGCCVFALCGGALLIVILGQTATQEHAIKAGYEAGLDGIPATANPYAGAQEWPESSYHKDWAENWQRGFQEMRDKEAREVYRVPNPNDGWWVGGKH